MVCYAAVLLGGPHRRNAPPGYPHLPQAVWAPIEYAVKGFQMTKRRTNRNPWLQHLLQHKNKRCGLLRDC